MATPAGSPSLGLPPTELAKVQQGQAVMIWTVGMFCIFGWDYLMNLPTEIKRIWRNKFTYYSVLYLLNRYFGLLQFALEASLITTPITNAFSVDICKRIFRWEPVGALITTLLSQGIMLGRVCTMYGRSLVIAGILGTVMLAEFGFQAYTLTVVSPMPALPGVLVPCTPHGRRKYLDFPGFWTIPLFFDTMTFLLTFHKVYVFYKAERGSPMVSVSFRDGLAYFAAIFCMNLINVALFVTQDATLRVINFPPTLMLNVIMTCRLVLNHLAPQSVYTPYSDNPSGPKLPLFNQALSSKSFVEMSVTSQPRETTRMVATSNTVPDPSTDTNH